MPSRAFEGLGRELLAVGNGDLDLDVAGAAMRARNLGNRLRASSGAAPD